MLCRLDGVVVVRWYVSQVLVRQAGEDGAVSCLDLESSGESDSQGTTAGSGGGGVVMVTGSEGGALRVWDVVVRSRG